MFSHIERVLEVGVMESCGITHVSDEMKLQGIRTIVIILIPEENNTDDDL